MTIVNPVTLEKTRQYERQEYDEVEDGDFISNTTSFIQNNDDDDIGEDSKEPRLATIIVKQHIPITDDMTEVKNFLFNLNVF